MMLTAYRLSLKKYRARAFTGDGARRAGGRWNPRGFPVVYTSATLSLAALEFLVHLGSTQDAPELVSFRVEIEERLVQHLRRPKNWRRLKLRDTRELGKSWLEEASSPVLCVSSFVVPNGDNFILNPLHPQFGRLKISAAEDFVLDARLYEK